jgi:methionyl-tRNA synthetase
MMAPFLPHGANRVHRVMGGEGDFVPMPQLVEVTDLDDGKPYPIITGEYSATPRWESRPVVVGTAIGKPTPVFTKFDPSVVEEELDRMRGEQVESDDQ